MQTHLILFKLCFSLALWLPFGIPINTKDPVFASQGTAKYKEDSPFPRDSTTSKSDRTQQMNK